MGLATNNKLAIVDIGNGLNVESFSDYPSLIKDCVSKLDLIQLKHLANDVLPTFIFEREFAENPPKIEKVVKPKKNDKISACFLRRIQNAGCVCGKQKLEGYPLCGSCFVKLPRESQQNLRRLKGSELEDAYNSACQILNDRKEAYRNARR